MALLIASVTLLAGCHTTMQTPAGIADGRYSQARAQLASHMTQDRSSRAYLLDRMRLGVTTLADGYPRSAQHVFENLYQLLRTQGINKDRTVASVVLYQGVKIWKGEPFEQALAMAYYGFDQAEQGSWDNARAAAKNALFNLRDFGDDKSGQSMDTYEIAQKSLVYERAIKAGATSAEAKKKANYLDHGYVAHKSDFTLGYLLNAIANQQLGRSDEASDNYHQVVELDSNLQPLVNAFQSGKYNTVLVVSWGLGPRKVGYGPDDALGKFVPRSPSDDAPLSVSIAGSGQRSYPQVQDVNTMAASHMWRSLEDIRVAKSYLGSGLLVGGLVAADYGAHKRNDVATYAGLGAMVAGALMKVSAHVDTRYCDVMPQRFYVLPLTITSPGQRITLEVAGRPASRLVLTGLGPPHNDRSQAQLRYVSLVTQTPGGRAPKWATSGQIFYTTPDASATTGKAVLPYILGGTDLRPPSAQTLADYQQAGYLNGMTPAELGNLYGAEHIKLTTEDQQGYAGKNVLLGGSSLVCPVPGTTGFAELFGQIHPPYQPKSQSVREVYDRVRAERGKINSP